MRHIFSAATVLVALSAVSLLPRDLPTDARLKSAHRNPAQNGWVFVHLEGSPAEIGFQHGYLLAP